jgi:hypothetical protein
MLRRAGAIIYTRRDWAGGSRCQEVEGAIYSEATGMRCPTARGVLRWSLVGVAVLVASGLLMSAAGIDVRLGRPPEFGWTAYPILAVSHWGEPGGSLPPSKLPPRQSREVLLGTLVTWADGTKTLYLRR